MSNLKVSIPLSQLPLKVEFHQLLIVGILVHLVVQVSIPSHTFHSLTVDKLVSLQVCLESLNRL